MKKTKRLLSLLTALAITASAFASLAIPASAADTTYFTVDFSSPTTTGISAQGKTGQGPVAYGDYLTFSMGARGDGGDNTSNITIDDGALKITSGGYATSQRGASIAFADEAGVPKFDGVAEGNVLQISFDAKYQDNASTIQFFGITDSTTTSGGAAVNDPYLSIANNAQIPIGEWVKVILSVDKAEHAYATILDAGGKLLSAKSFTAVGDSFTKIGFYGGATAVWIDNLSVKQVQNTYANLTVNVATSAGTAISGVTVKVDKATETTDASGNVTLAVPSGTYALEASKDGYEATKGQEDAAKDSVTMEGADQTKNLVLNLQDYDPTPTTVTVGGGQLVMTAPHTAESLASKAFTVASVLDQKNVPIENAEIEWTIAPADEHVSIANGVVTVTKGFDAGETHVKEFTVTATATNEHGNKAGTKAIKISDYLFYEPGVNEATYGGTIGTLNNGEKTIINPTAATTDTITLPEEITFNNGSAKTLTYKAMHSEKGYYTYERSLTLKDESGKTVFGPVYIAGPAGTSGMVIGTASEFKGTELDKTWHTFNVDTWVNVSMMFVTYSSGNKKLKVQVNDGDVFEYDIDSSVSGIKTIALKSGAVMTARLVAYKDFVIEETDVSGMELSGDKEFSVVSGAGDSEKTYNVEAIVIDDDEDFTWTTTIPGATIAKDQSDPSKAVLTVPDTAAAGGKIKAVSSKSTEAKPKEAEIDVTIEQAKIMSATINGSSTLDTETAKANQDGVLYSLTDVKDQFGDDITELVEPEWTLESTENGGVDFQITAEEAGTVKAIKAVYDGTKLKSVTTENKAVTAGANTVHVDAPAGTKVMIWDSLTGIKPLSDEVKEVQPVTVTNAEIGEETGKLTVTDGGTVIVKATAIGQDLTKTVTIADYSKVVNAPTEGDIDVSDIVNYGADTYTVTLSDGSTFTKTATAGKISLTSAEIGDATKLEITPNYKFTFAVDTDGYTKADVKEDGYGFTKEATAAAGSGTGIQAQGVELEYGKNAFEVDLPDGRYDMTFYKADTNRTHIKVNGFYTVPEADYTDGDGSDPINAPGIYTQRDVIVEGGVAKVTADDWSKGVPKLAAVEITKKSDLEPRKRHIWIAGDSTVTNYRPTPTLDTWANGTRRTGWGQLFEYYLQDSVIVDDFAHSGDYSVGWYNSTFPSVLQYAQEGDYFFVQFGINDRADKNNCPTSLMAEYLGKMVDECREKGVIPVLITPEICISQYGQDITEHQQSTGSGNAGWFNTNKTVAEAKEVLLIDLADLSGKLWAEMGRTWVAKNYFLWNSTTDTSVDPQHMSYQGAKIVASLVATSIYDQIESGAQGKDATETFANIPVNVKTDANIAYKDAADNNADKTVTRQAVTFSLDKTAEAATFGD